MSRADYQWALECWREMMAKYRAGRSGNPDVAALLAAENSIAQALTEAYHLGRIEYCHFSPAYDVTAARAAALSWLLPCDSGSDRHGEDAERSGGAECEASQSGDAEGSASPNPKSPHTGKGEILT